MCMIFWIFFVRGHGLTIAIEMLHIMHLVSAYGPLLWIALELRLAANLNSTRPCPRCPRARYSSAPLAFGTVGRSFGKGCHSDTYQHEKHCLAFLALQAYMILLLPARDLKPYTSNPRRRERSLLHQAQNGRSGPAQPKTSATSSA